MVINLRITIFILFYIIKYVQNVTFISLLINDYNVSAKTGEKMLLIALDLATLFLIIVQRLFNIFRDF